MKKLAKENGKVSKQILKNETLASPHSHEVYQQMCLCEHVKQFSNSPSSVEDFSSGCNFSWYRRQNVCVLFSVDWNWMVSASFLWFHHHHHHHRVEKGKGKKSSMILTFVKKTTNSFHFFSVRDWSEKNLWGLKRLISSHPILLWIFHGIHRRILFIEERNMKKWNSFSTRDCRCFLLNPRGGDLRMKNCECVKEL